MRPKIPARRSPVSLLYLRAAADARKPGLAAATPSRSRFPVLLSSSSPLTRPCRFLSARGFAADTHPSYIRFAFARMLRVLYAASKTSVRPIPRVPSREPSRLSAIALRLTGHYDRSRGHFVPSYRAKDSRCTLSGTSGGLPRRTSRVNCTSNWNGREE